MLPIFLKFVLKFIFTAKVSIQLLLRDKLQEIRVEPHLIRMMMRGENTHVHRDAHLVSGDRIEEGRYPFVEEVQNDWQVHDKGSSKCFDIVLLQNRQDLRPDGSHKLRKDK